MILVLGIALITFFYEIFFLGQGFFVGDGIFIYAPHKIFIWESLRRGVIPFWNPNLWAGFPEIGDMVLGIFDPFNIFYFLFPGTAGVTVVVLISFFLALTGTYLFLKSHHLSGLAAVVGAIIFTFAGSMINISSDPIRLESICFLPWILLAVENKRFFLTTALLTLNFLVGQTQFFYMSLCFVIGYLLFNSTKKNLWLFLTSTVFSLGLTAFTILPQLQLIPLSSRANAAMSYNTIWSLHPASFLRFFLADFWGKQTAGFSWGPNVTYSFGYLGFIPLVLILLNLRRINRKNCFFAVAAATSLLISLGKYNPFYGIFLFIPGFAFFRNPSSWLVIYSFAAAILTADFVDKMKFENNHRLKKTFYFITTGLLLIGIPLILINYYFPGFPHEFLVTVASVVKKNLSLYHTVTIDQQIFYFIGKNCLILGLLMGIFCLARFKKGVLVLVIFFDLFFFSKGDFFISTWSKNIFSQTAASKQVKFLKDNLNGDRFLSTPYFLPFREIRTENYYQNRSWDAAAREYKQLFSLLPPNIYAAYNIPSINGYSTFILQDYRDYFRKFSPNLSQEAKRLVNNRASNDFLSDPTKINFDAVKFDDPRISALSVRYILSGEELALPTNAFNLINLNQELRLYENKNVSPRAQIFDKNNRQKFLPHILDLNANEVKIIFTSYQPENGDYLLLRDTYYPDWIAADQKGHLLSIEKKDIFRKVPLNLTTRQVSFHFIPSSFYQGLKISLLTLMVLILIGTRRFYLQLHNEKSELQPTEKV